MPPVASPLNEWGVRGVNVRLLPVVGVAVLLTGGFAGCSSSDESSAGSNPQGVVSVEPFDSLDISTGLVVELQVKTGSTQRVELEAASGSVTTEVSGNTLSLSQTGDDGKATVTIPELSSVRVTNGSKLTATGEAGSYTLTLDSGSEAMARDLSAKTVNVDFSSGSTGEISASDTVAGELDDGSILTVSGGADTAAVEVNDGSEISTS